MSPDSGPPSDPDLVEISLLDLPVALWAASQEHANELIREFTLIAASQSEEDHQRVPRQLTQLIEALNREYGMTSGEQEAQLAAAAAAGVESIPALRFRVPPGVSEAAVALGAMLDEADAYCKAGRHLLTLATPPEQVRFRNWYLDEFVRQVDGQPPRPWPEYPA
ncbi:MAG TPA: hypothetical protein VG184_13410 [Acidimicrobiales bacterium]|jgi:hypothetical protein|nr:hypothetical protein [Acidimicrobiales bacterium]